MRNMTLWAFFCPNSFLIGFFFRQELLQKRLPDREVVLHINVTFFWPIANEEEEAEEEEEEEERNHLEERTFAYVHIFIWEKRNNFFSFGKTRVAQQTFCLLLPPPPRHKSPAALRLIITVALQKNRS